MDIKIINHSDNPTPKYATKGSADRGYGGFGSTGEK
jgi:hypothetical protein